MDMEFNFVAEFPHLLDAFFDVKEENKHLRELLRQCNVIMPTCPFCKGNLRTWHRIAYNESIRIGHTDGCELAMELATQ